MLRNIKFGYTVSMMPVLAAIGFALVTIQSVWMGKENETRLTTIEKGYFPALQLSRDLEELLTRIQRELQSSVAAADEEMVQQADKIRDMFMSRLQELRTNPVQQKQEVDMLTEKIQEYYAFAVKCSRRLIAAEKSESVEEGSGEDLTGLLESMTAQYSAIRKELEKSTGHYRNEMALAFDAAHEALQASTLTNVLVTVIFITLLALLSFFILSSVTKALKDMTRVAQDLASGDLSQPNMGRRGRNEIAQLSGSIDQMADALRSQVGAIKEAASRVIQNTSEVTGATAQLSAAASEQASSIAETTSTIEEIKQSGQVARKSADNIVETSEKSVEVSTEGLGAVDASAAEIGRIREQVEAIATGVEGLRTRVSEVGEIIAMVNQVAEQSNLLAVNASIEAAKAGESGLGFAVVAQEVKSLAAQSKQATAQVRNTLGGIQDAIEEVSTTAREGVERSESGVRSIQNTGEMIRGLGEVISNASEAAKRIAINANEQVVGLEQVAQAMTNVNQAAAENLLSTQQVEKGGDELNSMARELEQLVAKYQMAN